MAGATRYTSNRLLSSHPLKVAGKWQEFGGFVPADGDGDESGLIGENKLPAFSILQ